jgi:hypothetical protein
MSSGGGGPEDGAAPADDDLAVDYRRAKRLKKLARMLTCSAAQSATLRFKRYTWLMLGLILATHIVGYAVISTEISGRFE